MVRLKLGKLQESWQYAISTYLNSIGGESTRFSVVIKDIKINPPLKAEDFNQVLDRIYHESRSDVKSERLFFVFFIPAGNQFLESYVTIKISAEIT